MQGFFFRDYFLGRNKTYLNIGFIFGLAVYCIHMDIVQLSTHYFNKLTFIGLLKNLDIKIKLSLTSDQINNYKNLILNLIRLTFALMCTLDVTLRNVYTLSHTLFTNAAHLTRNT